MSEQRDLRDVAKDCVHCGFCLPACPTYQLWGEEMDSPRGRIHLVNQVLDGAPLTAAAASHFDRCLGCMACMTACPSGVQYDVLIEAARTWTEDPSAVPAPAAVLAERTARRPAKERMTRAAIFSVFPYPERLRVATAPLRLAQRAGLVRWLARSGLAARVSPTADAALRLAPPASAAAGRLPERVRAVGVLPPGERGDSAGTRR
jgi:glycolate oxidase iron-sulfur subunit